MYIWLPIYEHQEGKPLNMFYVELEPKDNNEDIYKIKLSSKF